ncbi:ADP-ribosylglycohydrolase [Aggregicoccus sp. 17bor-14]|uniref:ADP-ribosylglycohydrolase family protein n=1 Tax=Myxococcaceae TaxID=31 RepID=UPI00129C78FB|nr:MULTISPECIES: ADP-ribosylglycohydrolase family protein [Myxococcaceae]MBF5043251.1 ADP-ribosylglycohydrolase family protein [Simulacricoccus sp. 17bor-14]MRI89008.1 ADP-ribosylglycohydrolase [Aggregicoccus sp. 17bor-14]
MTSDRREACLAGALLGTAMGDAVGLAREGLQPARALRLFGGPPLRPQLLPGRGMGSDDTDHACLVGQSLLASGGEPGRFVRALAWRLRGWLLTLPAGIGWATLRALLRLWLGWSPERSGVRSAGNGPAMRAPLLGVCWAHDDAALRAHVEASTRLTHTDPRALDGALLVAWAAALGARGEVQQPEQTAGWLAERASTPQLAAALSLAATGLAAGETVAQYAERLGLARGVTGFVVHTVPVALYAWLAHRADFRQAVESVVLLGGDTDTTGAIVGALAGATLGADAVPPEWLAAYRDWPRGVAWMRRLAARLARAFPSDGAPVATRPEPLCWPALPLRNLAFTLVVLAHGLRRLLPPY